HTRAGRFAEAAVCCRVLESIYHDAGYPEEATRYGELADKYEERTSASTVETEKVVAKEWQAEPQVASPAGDPVHPTVAAKHAAAATGLFFHAPGVAPMGESAAEAAEFEVHSGSAAEKEIDISAEWEGELSGEPPAVSLREEVTTEALVSPPAAPPQHQAIEETIEEIRFYLTHSMAEQARMAFAKLERLKPDAAMLSAIDAEIEAASAQTPAEPEVVEEMSVEEIGAAPVEEVTVPPPNSGSGALREFVSELDTSLGDSFLPKTVTREVERISNPVMPEHAVASTAPTPAGMLSDFVSDLEASLGDTFLPQAPVPQPEVEAEPKPQPATKKASKSKGGSVQGPQFAAPMATAGVATAPALEPVTASPTFTYQPSKMRPLAPEAQRPVPMSAGRAGIDLADMFGELKHELEEDTATADEDPETHYNLGVAFREMGLLDEAIGELQKVCLAVDRGHTFPQLMQTYT